MDTSSALALITSSIGSFGAAALAILALIVSLAVGFLVFRWGWRKLSSAAGVYDYMDSYRNANFQGVNDAIMRSKGNNSADKWGL